MSICDKPLDPLADSDSLRENCNILGSQVFSRVGGGSLFMARFIPVGEAVTRSEQKMLDYLQHALPENWVVFGNAQFTTGELTREVDAIVVGDRCVWVVDEKGFGARIKGDEHTWILADGSARERVLNNVLHAAKMVKENLRLPTLS